MWDKAAWRAEILARRKALAPETREHEADALIRQIGVLPWRFPAPPVRGAAPGVAETMWVCAYVPVGGEPGSIAMLDALRARGARVLLPVTGEPGPLEWAEYRGPERLRRGRFGLREPDGEPIADALGLAEVILIPALAVDRRGTRLGRGAGYYDRSLGTSRADARLVAVVRDDEVVDNLPAESHDHRMGWALTPFGGLLELGE
ncbi:5-formyltetrahydrofolate cyclo-ligase [Nocardia sp. NBC_01503]|uniref:5-formyltetrahydrofolate cyclo-ligase n=1 Tax=Nocardia sp. NBC_01503 TaxID=2975997 RepID=UPI002E7B79C4|nr:5-formyltetrahydrofolate cyclo-ligase [Nocardia sp. NBC_01503]WTL36310.1 5-formyltetrahydrofolate cyclo-ligase [Nocardia sp. NBC_01503]